MSNGQKMIQESFQLVEKINVFLFGRLQRSENYEYNHKSNGLQNLYLKLYLYFMNRIYKYIRMIEKYINIF